MFPAGIHVPSAKQRNTPEIVSIEYIVPSGMPGQHSLVPGSHKLARGRAAAWIGARSLVPHDDLRHESVARGAPSSTCAAGRVDHDAPKRGTEIRTGGIPSTPDS